MIKKGDKLVCIKNVYHYEYGHINFKKGSVYEIAGVCNDGVCNSYLIYTEDKTGASISFDKKSTVYNTNFISLAEWREQQINSILED
jgi:hypothetical protein